MIFDRNPKPRPLRNFVFKGFRPALLSLVLATTAAPWPLAAGATEEPEVLGFVEWIVIQDTGLRLKARLDTGALTSSMHAVDVEPFEKNGEQWVRFRVPLNDHHELEGVAAAQEADPDKISVQFERPVVRTVDIQRKGAEPQTRHVVMMAFCINGGLHEAEFSLTDRHNFMYPALLGRRYMTEDKVVVDSSASFLAGDGCDYTGLEDLVSEHAET